MLHGFSGSILTRHLSGWETAHLLELVQKCVTCTTSADFDEIMKCLGRLVPFQFFACLFSQSNGAEVCDKYHVVATSYPEGWVRQYRENGYHRIDPVVLECIDSPGIQYWADTYRKRPPSKEFVSAAEDYGLRSGYTSGIRNLAGTRRGLLSVSGDRIPKEYRTGLVLEIVMPHLHQAMERTVCMKKAASLPAISPREMEVLKWIKHGKTTWEVSVIIGVSERTVKFHVMNVMKKLNASSRAQAVAIATEHGLIDLG